MEVKKDAAMIKMKILARRIYDSTPGIETILPKKKSKILLEADEEAEEKALRARNFVTKCEQIQEVRNKRKANEEINKAERDYQKYLNKAEDPREIAEEKRYREEIIKAKNAHGSIADKDLVVEIEAQDWESLYEKNYRLYVDAFREARRLDQVKSNKLQNYIFREQEYRHVIEELKTHIDRVS
mmetsp:Transcript_16818/g.21292  ORF Transcript_16818/g.21292 Transcript_16818/m.21292 type:complete len:184 (+) Transcript_16818:206-757(+)|eukprot:CAMPEP_0170464478 /NCGR_PEP_ID=MMETSP0123-20130129/9192_1 /TAXON_ID=182087 /ORGANISM="Favella ehrenbergii, Strain Fehren 1" /LENGTH=183 /DNA_ID=CAMNT_0010730155 /DNA_START=205 /DNA_END=756 /DNA_ORIENTATION=+